MNPEYDIAIVGSGFAGSLMAMIARRLGRSVLLLERGKHPRFAIGESSTPLSNLLLEDLSYRYNLPAITPLSKWGTWQNTYPELVGGLKRGFTFYHHKFGNRAALDPERQDQLLVASSPRDASGDTHWFRADVDAFFVREAQKLGVDYQDEVHLETARVSENAMTLEGTRHGAPVTFAVDFVIDATGPRGFLHQALALPEFDLPDLPATQALYTHFTGVRRISELGLHQGSDAPPYPVDDAAVHHVFDGGWIWVLRFANGITSAGVAADRALADRLRLSEGAPAWQRLLDCLPTVRDQFANAEPARPFVYSPRLAFRSGVIAGERWAMLPSAAGFVNPLLSTGFPLALLGVARLAEIMEHDWGSAQRHLTLSAYSVQTRDELLATARLIGSLYRSMNNFPLFASLTLLYFAAASYSETARRLGRSQLAASYLLHDHPRFQTENLYARARLIRTPQETESFAADIVRFIEPFNVAGLGDPTRRNWYPADAQDMIRAAPKLGVTGEEVARFLASCGF